MDERKTIDDIKWEFITELIMENENNKIDDDDMSLICRFTEKIKKELGL